MQSTCHASVQHRNFSFFAKFNRIIMFLTITLPQIIPSYTLNTNIILPINLTILYTTCYTYTRCCIEGLKSHTTLTFKLSRILRRIFINFAFFYDFKAFFSIGCLSKFCVAGLTFVLCSVMEQTFIYTLSYSAKSIF